MTTLLEVRTRCKQESDSVNSSFISDGEWDNLINSSYQEAYGLYVQAYGSDYFVQSPSTGYAFTTNGTSQFFALPADFWKLLGVDVLYGNANQWVSLKPFAFGDRNKFSMINSPIPAAGQSVRVFYIPTVTALAVDADVLVTGITANGGDEYVIADACLKALAKEESDVSVFAARKQALVERLNAEAENRDAGQPAAIVDSRGRGTSAMQYRLNGTNLWLIGFQISGWPGPDWDLDRAGWW